MVSCVNMTEKQMLIPYSLLFMILEITKYAKLKAIQKENHLKKISD